MVRKVTPQKKELKMKKVKATSADLLSKNAINNGWPIQPTARSETARFANKMFAEECSAVLFQIVSKTARFPKIAVKQSIRFTAQTAIP